MNAVTSIALTSHAVAADGDRSPTSRSGGSSESGVSPISVLIVHLNPVISAGLTVLLRRHREFKVLGSLSERSTSQLSFAHRCAADVVVADYESGIRLTEADPGAAARLLILTDQDSEARIWGALERGARGYLLLGCSITELSQAIRTVGTGGVAVSPLVARRITERIRRKALTLREEAVLGELMLGLSDKRISLKLGVAVGTVKTHVKGILSKLNAGNRTEAVAIARRCGILMEQVEMSRVDATEGAVADERGNDKALGLDGVASDGAAIGFDRSAVPHA